MTSYKAQYKKAVITVINMGPSSPQTDFKLKKNKKKQ